MNVTLLPWAFSIVAASAAWCGALAAQSMPISVGYTNTSSFTGLFIAKDQGMFAKRGIDVNLVLIGLNSNIPPALIGGSVQIGGATPPVFLQAVTGGLDLVVIAGGAVNDIRNKDGAGVVARTGSNITTAKDFEGRRVGVPGLGAYMHVLFRRWLLDHGANDRKVSFVEVPLAQGSDILKSGTVDAMLVGEPFYSRVIRAKTGYLVAPYLSEMPDGLFAIYFSATREWANRHGPTVAAFRDALVEATEFLARDPAEARQIVGRATRLPSDVVAAMALPTLKAAVPSSDLRYWSDTLIAQGLIRNPPDAGALVVR